MNWLKNYFKGIKNDCAEMFGRKFTIAQLIIMVFYVACYLCANILVRKNSWEFNVFGLTCAISPVNFLLPFTYIMSDVFSEVWGYKFSSFTRYIAVACQVFVSAMITLAVVCPGAPSLWTPADQDALVNILGGSWRVTFASCLAFLIGDFANDKVFKRMKAKDGDKRFGLRAVTSSVVGEYCDSTTFYCIGLPWFFSSIGVGGVFATITFQVIYRTLLEVICLPVSKGISTKLKKTEEYLG